MNQPEKIKVILIDPYRKELRKAEVSADIHTWHQLLMCSSLCAHRLVKDSGTCLDIWFDDEFLLNEPLAPWFEVSDLRGGHQRYHGYAFLANRDEEGNSISVGDAALAVPSEMLARMADVRFENYEQRLGENAHMDLRMRMPELEMPGRFKFIDICPDCGKVHH